ncbi:MAG: Ig-like domain-containing protein, partial [Campylobacterota bacterium]|nr:Ig-like domain-containing protein [Campylobacterota bacterium]
YDTQIEELMELRNKVMAYAIANFRDIKISDLYHTFYTDPTVDDNMPPISYISTSHYTEGSDPLSILLDYHDIEGDNVNVEVVNAPQYGTLKKDFDRLLYIPDTSASYDTNFTIALSDGKDTTYQTIDLRVYNGDTNSTQTSPLNFDVNGSQSYNIDATQFGNFSSTSQVVVTLKTPPLHGRVVVNGINIIYTPYSNYRGEDSFVVIADDQNGGVVEKSISFEINSNGLYFSSGMHQIAISNQTLISDQIGQIFGHSDVNYILKYDSTNQKWLGYSNKAEYLQKMQNSNVESITQINAGEGVFVNVANATTLDLPKDSAYSLINQINLIDLSTGWHLLGSSELVSIESLLQANSNIKVILHYKDNVWYFYTPDAELKKQYLLANFKELTDLNAYNIGFWTYIE